ncbi:MAG: protein translocase subunit SecD [Pseudonocardia sp.]
MAPTPGQISPWRYLASFAVVVAILYALVFFTGDGKATPKLGIDLQGGTRVTLQARTESGAEPPREQLLQAQQIIEQRVNGLGVSGAEVVLDGSNLVITVPGEEGDQARSLGQTAQLRFREVVAGPFPATPAAAPGAPGEGSAPAAPGDGSAPAVMPGQPGTSPAPSPTPEQPQGAGAAPAVAPVSYATPLDPQAPPPSTPAPPAPPTPPTTGDEPADPEVAAQITQAREVRQNPDLLSTDQNVQQAAALAAVTALDCGTNDPLRGYDVPTLPLVACNQDGTEKYVLSPVITDSQGRPLEGTHIESAQANFDTNGLGYVIDLTFDSTGAAIWGDYTSTHVGTRTAFVLDGEVVSAPEIRQAIYGPTQISGTFSQAEAQNLAGVLRYGSLPLSFASSEAQTVSATLGLASLEAGLIAGGVGLVLVFVYCLFYYRVLGVLTILSLVLSGVIVYAVLVLLGRWIGFTLDLAGVAGFIVAIGITADSFVIYFERLKDEVREGRSFRSAVPRGWVRARRTILSADAVSFLASAVLYILAVGQVKGFAFTLGLATVLDLVVVFLVTHPLVELAARSKTLSSPALSGLGSVARIGAEQRRARSLAGAGKGA